MAADKGDARSQCSLGVLYEQGSGVSQDYVEAYKWYSLSAALGDTNAVAAQASIYPKSAVAFENVFYARYPELASYKAVTDAEAQRLVANGLRGTKDELIQAFAKATKEVANRLLARIQDIKAAARGEAQVRALTPHTRPNFPPFSLGPGMSIRMTDTIYTPDEWKQKVEKESMEKAEMEIQQAKREELLKYALIDHPVRFGESAILALSSGSATAPLNSNDAARQQGAAPDTPYQLGWRYEHGYGVVLDYTNAMKWYRKAFDQGVADAAINLGVMYQAGRGVQRDDIEAYKWYCLAADRGSHKIAMTNRDNLLRSLTPEQIAEGQRRAIEFKPAKESSQ